MVLLGAKKWPQQGHPDVLSADLINQKFGKVMISGNDSLLYNVQWL